MKIVKPVAARVENNKPDHFGSDCAMAGHHIGCAMSKGAEFRRARTSDFADLSGLWSVTVLRREDLYLLETYHRLRPELRARGHCA